MSTEQLTSGGQRSHFRVRRVSNRDVLQVENGPVATKEIASSIMESSPHSSRICIEGFELDLDTEPESCDDDMEDEDERLVVSYPSSQLDVPDGGGGVQGQKHSKWSVTKTAVHGSIRLKLSKVPTGDVSLTFVKEEPEMKSPKMKFPTNRIQLRNGRLLPPSSLAIYACQKGPNFHNNTSTPSSSKESSPDVHLRRSWKATRKAIALESDDEEEHETMPSNVGATLIKQEPPDSDASFEIPDFQDSSQVPLLVANAPQPVEEEEEEEEEAEEREKEEREEESSPVKKRAKLHAPQRKMRRRKYRRKTKVAVSFFS